MLVDTLYEVLQSGGWVMLPIWFVGAVGFYLCALVVSEIRYDFFRYNYEQGIQTFLDYIAKKNFVAATQFCKSKKGLVYDCLGILSTHSDLSEEGLRNKMKVELSRRVHLLDRHLPLVTVMAAAAPLLGLLGTVTGMVHTFEVITEFGNSNPVLMADGISEALITTQSGLLIAFPLIIIKHRLEEKIQDKTKQVNLAITQFVNQRYHESKVA